jgi:hypothetical protein
VCKAPAAARGHAEALGVVRTCCGWSGRHSRAPGQNENCCDSSQPRSEGLHSAVSPIWALVVIIQLPEFLWVHPQLASHLHLSMTQMKFLPRLNPRSQFLGNEKFVFHGISFSALP